MAEISLEPAAELVADRTEVEPVAGLGGGGKGLGRDGGKMLSSQQALLLIVGEGFGIALVHAPEATELAVDTVPISVMINVLGRQLAAGDLVDGFDALHDLDGEG